jgi:dTDP-4-amino-4,6-dideoxygalactose transaminase
MSNHTDIPFLDLVTPHTELEQELTEVFHKALRTGRFIGGPMVEEFEQAFADLCDAKYAVGVSSGTDALRFALMACGVQPGDVVVTVPNTFIATTEAISQAGGLPEFVDIDERTYNMDPVKLREYLERQCTVDPSGKLMSRRSGRPVTAVIPVHLYGQTADMDPILELADQCGLVVLEDACQAHGAEYFSRRDNCWKKAGSMGAAAAFSFYPGKNLAACGEAGAVTTNDAGFAQKVRMLRDHGQNRKYYHEVEGYNGRLDAIQAGILQVKLRHLPWWNEQRREAAARYRRLFAEAGSDALAPFEPDWARAVYHLYVVRVPDREGLMRHLAEANIGTGIHYPAALHLQSAYSRLGYGVGDFPVTESAAAEIVSLPMYPQLTSAQQEKVVAEATFFWHEAAGELDRNGPGDTDTCRTDRVIAAARDDEFLPSQSSSAFRQA